MSKRTAPQTNTPQKKNKPDPYDLTQLDDATTKEMNSQMETMRLLVNESDKKPKVLWSPPMVVVGDGPAAPALHGVGKLHDPSKDFDERENPYNYSISVVVGDMLQSVLDKNPGIAGEYASYVRLLDAATKKLSDVAFDAPDVQAATTMSARQMAEALTPPLSEEMQQALEDTKHDKHKAAMKANEQRNKQVLKAAREEFYKRMSYVPFRDDITGEKKDTFRMSVKNKAIFKKEKKDSGTFVPIEGTAEQKKFHELVGPHAPYTKREVRFSDALGGSKWEAAMVQDPTQALVKAGMVVRIGVQLRLWSTKSNFGVRMLLVTNPVQVMKDNADHEEHEDDDAETKERKAAARAEVNEFLAKYRPGASAPTSDYVGFS